MSDGRDASENSRIRQATAADASTIVHFVRELAKFEREPLSSVKLDEQTVLEQAFGDTQRFEVLIAEAGGQPVGMALFFENYSTWAARPGIWIEELFVEEDFRGQGLGRQLVEAVVDIARSRGCGRVELAVLDWNPATDFYRHHGFEELDEWRTYRLPLKP